MNESVNKETAANDVEVNNTNKNETAMEKMRKNIDTMSLPNLIDPPKLNDVIAFKVQKN